MEKLEEKLQKCKTHEEIMAELPSLLIESVILTRSQDEEDIIRQAAKRYLEIESGKEIEMYSVGFGCGCPEGYNRPSGPKYLIAGKTKSGNYESKRTDAAKLLNLLYFPMGENCNIHNYLNKHIGRLSPDFLNQNMELVLIAARHGDFEFAQFNLKDFVADKTMNVISGTDTVNKEYDASCIKAAKQILGGEYESFIRHLHEGEIVKRLIAVEMHDTMYKISNLAFDLTYAPKVIDKLLREGRKQEAVRLIQEYNLFDDYIK
jgi:hypothetical protein